MRRLTAAALSLAALGVCAGTAAADPCADGLAAEHAGKLPQAHLLLSRCTAGAAQPPADAEAALARTKKKLAAGKFAPVAFAIWPASAELRVPALGDQPVGDPFEVWLPFGTHRYTVTAAGHQEVAGEIVVDDTSRRMVPLRLRPVNRTPAGGTVDFSEGGDGPAIDSPIVQPDPRPKKQKSLIPKRWLGPDPSAGAAFDRPAGARPAGARPRHPTSRPATRSWPWTLTWGL